MTTLKIASAIYTITNQAFVEGKGDREREREKKTNQLQSNNRITIITWAKIRLFRVIYQQNLGEMQIIVYCEGNKRGGWEAHLCLTNNLME